ncbi:MAG: hypothetical protein WD771_05845 [Gemmatimonadaceae bacterium]
MRPILTFCALVLALPIPLQGQRERAPRRPRLAAGADTNDAQAYLQQGHRVLEQNPGAAANAYYWAVRIDPASAAALYSLRMAVLMQRPTPFRAYMEGNRRVIFSREMRANDSLMFRALQMDPFLHLQHSRVVQFRYWRQIVESDPALAGTNPGRVDFIIEDLFNRTPPGTRARLAAAEGRFDYAIRLYGEAIEASKKPAYLYLDRGGVYALQGMNAPAIRDIGIGLTELKKEDADEEEDVVFYDSKALYEYSIGVLWLRQGDVEQARLAFGRAMEEDLSFYPAHTALARLALETGDTATALSEMALAAELAPREAAVHYQHGELLLAAGEAADAVAPLRKAIELEPYYANPQFTLAETLARTSDAAGAREAYQRFLALATRRDPRRAAATAALTADGGAP